MIRSVDFLRKQNDLNIDNYNTTAIILAIIILIYLKQHIFEAI